VPDPELLADSEAALAEVVRVRRRLHRRPEVGLDLPSTQQIVVDELGRLGLEPRLGTALSSATAVIEGSRPGPTILLRADMDALPVQEETGLSFASEIPGTMHACGHDAHVAVLLGAARLLLARRDRLAGTVLLMFQPGEEGWHGARMMLDEGLLDAADGRAAPSAAFALHITTRFATQTIDIRPGAMLAANDTIQLTLRGRGGHASTPHLAVDPITVAAEIVLALQTMVTRQMDVFDPAVITIAQLIAGTATNIIPETAMLGGTIRTVSEAARERVKAAVREVVAGVSAAHGATAELDIQAGYPVTMNDPDFTGVVANVVTDLAGAGRLTILDAPVMGAEDFSYVLQRIPGAIGFLGARPPDQDPETAPQNHSNRVVFDESAMAIGAAVYAAVALRHLGS
jgi:amidohydrolase